jgi:U3 small nucleolar RNA-associated protein 3
VSIILPALVFFLNCSFRSKTQQEEVDQVFHLHYQLLSACSSTASFYFAILLSPPSASNENLKHNVLRRLLEYRKGIKLLTDMELVENDLDGDKKAILGLASEIWDSKASDGHEEDEETDSDLEQKFLEEDSLELNQRIESVDKFPSISERKVGGVNTDLYSEKTLEPTSYSSVKKKSRRSKQQGSKKNQPSEEPTPAPNSAQLSDLEDDFVEPSSLSAVDSSDKRSKRHSLRFHASQVESKSRKRNRLGNGDAGGDADIPLSKSREQRRREELKKSDARRDREMAHSQKNDLDDEFEDVEGEDRDVYDLVKEAKKSSKEAKKKEYDDAKIAQR